MIGKHLQINLVGRDFVVGDIHGAYGLLDEKLAAISFDPTVDRLISVGDLIDRGPESHRSLEFLQRPYVHAIRGNHEQMVLELYEHGDAHPAAIEFQAGRNGFGWWLDQSQNARDAYVQAFRQLPLTIDVQTKHGLIGVVHADIPAGYSWAKFLSAISEWNESVVETALWSRKRLNSSLNENIPDLHQLYVGHTPMFDGVKIIGNVNFIDTGAVFSTLQQDRGFFSVIEIS